MFQPCQCHEVGFGTVDEVLISTVHRPHCHGDGELFSTTNAVDRHFAMTYVRDAGLSPAGVQVIMPSDIDFEPSPVSHVQGAVDINKVMIFIIIRIKSK